jgi:hypothetical protein
MGLINTQYFTNLTDQINSINVCAELQAQVDDIAAQLNDQFAAIRAQIAALNPYLALIISPGNLAEVITWIDGVINTLILPYVQTITTLEAQVVALEAQVTALVAAVENAANNIENCKITIPPIVVA